MPSEKKEKKDQFYLGNKNLPKPNTEFEWTPEMLKDIKKCTNDILYFAQNFFYIVNLDEGKIKIKLFDCQKRVLKNLKDNRYVCLLASRQIGKTTLMTIYALWIACFFNDQRILVVANKESTAINIFKRIRTAYEMLPNYLKPGVLEYGKTSLTLSNGSSIGISTTSSDAGRGDSCNVLILDELAFIQNHIVDQFWKSVYPIISSSKKSKIFVASTPNGTNNLFYELYHGATQDTTDNNGWKAERIDWWEIPGRDEKWKEDTIKALGSKEAFDQEFGNQFIEVGESVVGDADIEAMKYSVQEPAYILDEGSYKIWEPPQKGHLYAAGVDVAEGVGRNASNIEIFDFTDLTRIKQVAEYNNNLINPINFTQKLNEILVQWGSPPVLIERNNQGAQVVDGLAQNFLYKNIVSYSPSAGNTKFSRMGVMAHTNTKYKGVMNMRYWVNERKVVVFRGAEIIEELKNFVRLDNGTWKGRENTLDDRVMSTVWCLMILEKEICEKYYEILRFDENQKPLNLKGYTVFGGNANFLAKEEEDYSPMIFFSGNAEGPNDDMRFLEEQGWTKY